MAVYVLGVVAQDASSLRSACAESDVLDVVDGLVEQVGDVGVVERVDDGPSAAVADDEAEMAEDAELVGDGRLFHLDRVGELADGSRRFAEAAEDADTARRRERLHRLCDLACESGVELRGRGDPMYSVSHRLRIA